MSILAGQLVQNQILVCVSPNDTLNAALKVMTDNDFSQLPVLNNVGAPLGLITSDSIAKALLLFGAKVEDLRVCDAISKSPIYKADEELLDLLEPLLISSALLIIDTENNSGVLVGIITEYDTTQYFRQRAEDIVRVSDIEYELKNHLLTVYDSFEKESAKLREAIAGLSSSGEAMRKKAKIALKSLSALHKNTDITTKQIDEIIDKNFPLKEESKLFQDLTLSEFIQLANKAWDLLEPAFQISAPIWNKMIEDVRLTRNKLAHFRGDTTSWERQQLRLCTDWFKSHQPLSKGKEPEPEHIATVDKKTSELGNTLGVSMDVHADEPETNMQTQQHRVKDSSVKLIGVERSAVSDKYKPLISFLELAERRSNTPLNAPLSFSFHVIEERIGQDLPKAAREHPTWWLNSTYNHVQSWIDSGWRVHKVDLDRQVATFSRWLPENKDLQKIYTERFFETSYWARQFNVDVSQIIQAVNTVGHDPKEVAAYFELPT